MKAIFHIGAHRTGSSAIQGFLLRHREALAGRGVLYPSAHVKFGGHHSLAWALGVNHSARDPTLSAEEIVQSILREADRTRPHLLILSSEDFEFITASDALVRLKSLFNGIPIEIVMYVRRQDDLLISEYSEHVKMYSTRFSGSITDFYIRYNFINRYNFNNLLDRWSSVFGPNAISIRVYDKNLFPNEDVVADFISRLGLDIDMFGMGNGGKVNESLPAGAIELLRRTNRRQLNAETHQSLIALLGKVFSNRPESRELLSEENRRDLMSHFAKANNSVARKWLGRARLFGGVPEKGKSAVYPSRVESSEPLIDGLLDCIIELLDRPH